MVVKVTAKNEKANAFDSILFVGSGSDFCVKYNFFGGSTKKSVGTKSGAYSSQVLVIHHDEKFPHNRNYLLDAQPSLVVVSSKDSLLDNKNNDQYFKGHSNSVTYDAKKTLTVSACFRFVQPHGDKPVVIDFSDSDLTFDPDKSICKNKDYAPNIVDAILDVGVKTPNGRVFSIGESDYADAKFTVDELTSDN